MEENIKKSIDELFIKKKEKEDEALKIREESETKEEAFLNEFYQIRKTIIRPAMEEIKSYLDEKNYESVIIEKGQVTYDQDTHPASITIILGYDKKYASLREHPYFTVSVPSSGQSVHLSESTIGLGHSGHSGSAGEYQLGDLTKELLHNKIMKVLNEII
jgi:hypothetical protein